MGFFWFCIVFSYACPPYNGVSQSRLYGAHHRPFSPECGMGPCVRAVHFLQAGSCQSWLPKAHVSYGRASATVEVCIRTSGCRLQAMRDLQLNRPIQTHVSPRTFLPIRTPQPSHHRQKGKSAFRNFFQIFLALLKDFSIG